MFVCVCVWGGGGGRRRTGVLVSRERSRRSTIVLVMFKIRRLARYSLFEGQS